MSEYYVKFKEIQSTEELHSLSLKMNLEENKGPGGSAFTFFKASYPCDFDKSKFTYLVYGATNDEFENLNTLVKELEASNENEFRSFMTASGYCHFGHALQQ